MNNEQEEFYCVSCLCHRHRSEFSIWLSDTAKARNCDMCKNKDNQRIKSIVAESERKAKAKAMRDKQRQTKLDKEKDSAKRREIRARLYDLTEKRRLAREFEL